MTMKFRTIGAGIVTLLNNSSGDAFQATGFQIQTKAASLFTGSNRLVEVFYGAGDFPVSASSRSSNCQHDVTFRVEFTVCAPCEADLTILENSEATAGQLTTALEALKTAGQVANDSWDELFDLVWNILMDARNLDLGQSIGVLADRWISNVQKDNAEPAGEYVQLTGAAVLTLSTEELAQGEDGTATALEVIDGTIQNNDDTFTKVGVQNDYT